MCVMAWSLPLFGRDYLAVNCGFERLASRGGYVILPSVSKAVHKPRPDLDMIDGDNGFQEFRGKMSVPSKSRAVL